MQKNTRIYKDGDLQLFYESIAEGVMITGGKNIGSYLEIPESIEGCPVVSIGKKAFLGERVLRKVVIPKTVTVLGDFSFGQCVNLDTVQILGDKSVDVSGENTLFGKMTFVDCKKMNYIFLGTECSRDFAALLATLPCRMDAEYMFADKHMGDADWFEKWDNRLISFLREDDEEGYINLVLCGEEDIQRDLGGFVSDKRRKKAGLCFIRLLHSENISKQAEEMYKTYILSHNKGCDSDDAWRALLDEFGNDIEYFRLFTDMGGVRQDNLDGMLADMGAEFPETKAYLMKYKQDTMGTADVFDAFTL